MKKLLYEKTNLTPEVDYDPIKGRFVITGYSRPEDVREFYIPIIKYIEEYQKLIENRKLDPACKLNDLRFVFRFTYFNSASTKFISDLLFQVVKFKRIGVNFMVDWYYEEYDEDMREVGEDLSDMISYPFNFYSFRAEE